MQRACCFRIEFEPNYFLLFGLDFEPLLGLIFLVAIGLFKVFQFLLTLIFGFMAILVIKILSIFNYQICNMIPKGYGKYFHLIFSLSIVYALY